MRTVPDFLNAMRGFLGVTEQPLGSNRTRVGELYGWNGVPWCAETVSDAAKMAGFGLHTAAVAVIVSMAQGGEQGMRWVGGRAVPQPGWIVCYRFSSGTHTGVVESVTASAGTMTTIEGNWADRCQRLVRSIANPAVEGYAVLPFAVAGPKMTTPPSGVHYAVPGQWQQGDYGPGVTLWAIRLNTIRACVLLAHGQAWGPCRLDGTFDQAMALNVEAFQTGQQLTIDGQIGPDTGSAMANVERYLGIRY
jgi:hypothetical protein